jgi:isopentenyl diphosphate isomerase/L-lactate dehydrogenase-like FMN-dependent dehydrogenase
MPHAHPEIEMPDPVTIADVREIAQKRLDPAAWDYYITGADDEQTVRRNETIFKK